MKKLILSISFLFFVMNSRAQLSLVSSHINPNCYGDSSGTASVFAFGGFTPYTYLWNTSPPQITASITNLPVGTYIVIVTDSMGTQISDTITLIQPPPLTLNPVATPASCSSCPDGSINPDVNGGSPPYSFSPSNISTILPGFYTVCVTDAHNCSACDTVTVGFSTGIKEIQSPLFMVFPNPATDKILISSPEKIFSIVITDVFGKEITFTTQPEINISDFQEGAYFITLKTNKGIATKKFIKE